MLNSCEMCVVRGVHKRLTNIPTQALMMEVQNVYETKVFGRTLIASIAGGISAH